MKSLRTFVAVAFAAAVSLITPAVHAAAVDVTALVTDINAQMAPITSLATAVLTVFVGIKAFHWVRRALS